MMKVLLLFVLCCSEITLHAQKIEKIFDSRTDTTNDELKYDAWVQNLAVKSALCTPAHPIQQGMRYCFARIDSESIVTIEQFQKGIPSFTICPQYIKTLAIPKEIYKINSKGLITGILEYDNGELNETMVVEFKNNANPTPQLLQTDSHVVELQKQVDKLLSFF